MQFLETSTRFLIFDFNFDFCRYWSRGRSRERDDAEDEMIALQSRGELNLI